MLSCLAKIYSRQGQHEQAKILYHEALTIAENAPGPQPRYKDDILREIAELSRIQSHHEQAESLPQRVTEDES